MRGAEAAPRILYYSYDPKLTKGQKASEVAEITLRNDLPCYHHKMTDQNTNPAFQPLCGMDLERWRLENGLTKVAAADAFGLQKAKWEELTNPSVSNEPLSDPVVAMTLHLYRTLPGSAPVEIPPDVKEFYNFLGLQDTPHDREMFATLIGRSPPSVYRLLLHDGKPGRPLIRWIEAIRRLNLSSRKSMMLMMDVAKTVGERQQNSSVLTQGWTKQGEPGADE